MKDAVVLLSGGLDSTVCAYIAKQDLDRGRKPGRLHCLNLQYGQKHVREMSSAAAVAKELDATMTSVYVPIKELMGRGCSLIDSNVEIPKDGLSAVIPSTWVPQRNSIFLALAFGYAEVLGATFVYMGANQLDYSGYPDCRSDFLSKMDTALNFASKRFVEESIAIQIKTPLLDMTKAQIVDIGYKLGVPYELTWSCYEGAEKACGICDSCRIRKEAFSILGKEDPIPYESV